MREKTNMRIYIYELLNRKWLNFFKTIIILSTLVIRIV